MHVWWSSTPWAFVMILLMPFLVFGQLAPEADKEEVSRTSLGDAGGAVDQLVAASLFPSMKATYR